MDTDLQSLFLLACILRHGCYHLISFKTLRKKIPLQISKCILIEKPYLTKKEEAIVNSMLILANLRIVKIN